MRYREAGFLRIVKPRAVLKAPNENQPSSCSDSYDNVSSMPSRVFLIVFLSQKRSVAILSYLRNNLLVNFLSCTSSNFILITVEMIIKIPFLMIKGWPTVFVLSRNLLHQNLKCEFVGYKLTRGPWTATPGLIKIDGKGQSN